MAGAKLTDMDSRLPLLTVDTVIFPGLVLPIPVTDVQGRAVVRDLVENGGELVCGALAVRDGYELGERVFRSLYGTGCAATISEITLDADDDGPVEITLTGNRRFKVAELDGGGDYLVADVEWLVESLGDDPLGTATIAIDRFRRYAAAVTEISRPGLHIADLPDDPGTLSYLMSAAMTLITPDRQKLLEATDTTSRLAQLVGLLDTELAAIAAIPSLPPPKSTGRQCPRTKRVHGQRRIRQLDDPADDVPRRLAGGSDQDRHSVELQRHHPAVVDRLDLAADPTRSPAIARPGSSSTRSISLQGRVASMPNSTSTASPSGGGSVPIQVPTALPAVQLNWTWWLV